MASIVEDLDSQIERAETFYRSQFEKLSLRIENQEASDIVSDCSVVTHTLSI